VKIGLIFAFKSAARSAFNIAAVCAAMSLSACGFDSKDLDPRAEPLPQASLPLRLVLAEDAPGVFGNGNERVEIISALEEAADVWNQAVGRKIIVFDGTRVATDVADFPLDKTSRDGRNTIYIFNQFGDTRTTLGTETPTDILGLCVSRGFESDIALTLMANLTPNGNLVRASDLVSSTLRKERFDFQSVAIHEFGHALGLVHDKDKPDSVMWHQGLAVGRVNRALSDSDKRNLRQVLAQRYNFNAEISETTDVEPVPE